jgi:phosphatidate cytidylyltransferase
MKIRIVSAIIAVALVVALYAFFDIKGLYGLCTVLGIGCAFEYSRLTFRPIEAPRHLSLSFIVFTTLVLLVTVFAEKVAFFTLSSVAVMFLTMALLTVRRSEDLPHTLKIMSGGLVGMLYCGVFPAFAVKTLEFDARGSWLFAFLAIVFAGDSCAYFSGRLFGKTKLLEAVSPKKTIEGAIGGLIGSAIVAVIIAVVFAKFFEIEIPMHELVMTAIATGVFAQLGDLFESLLKRIAEVKDSGAIMPGHGGVLDRLDGVIFSAPVFYVLTRFLLFSQG